MAAPRRPERGAPPAYVDTPAGLLAADGTHYHTTEALLRDYAGPVVEAVGVGPLLHRAGAWLRSPRALAVLVLPALLAVTDWWLAAGLALVVYALWSALAPGTVVLGMVRAAPVLESAALQGLVYVAALSAFAAVGRLDAVWTGLAGFVAVRLGLVELALGPVVGAMQRSLYPLPPPDQTLRSLLVREALRRGVSLAGFDAIEGRVRAFWHRDAPDE